MSNAYAQHIAEGFSQKLIKEMYDRSVLDAIVNRDYEGEINGVGSKLNILNIDRITEKDFTGADMTADSLYENETELVIEKKKAFYWNEATIDKWASYIKNPNATVMAQKADERNKNMDLYVFGKYEDVGAGNRVGVDYTTGDVTVAATTGVVTGNGTTFTADMVGKGFKADGHTTWYRVKTYNSATEIVIEDDLDDVTSQYTGGAIAGGSSYTIEAASVLTITAANLLSKVAQLKLKLDLAEKNGYSSVPDMDRWLAVPPEFETTVITAQGVALHVDAAYQELVKKGYLGQLLGFNIFKTNRLTGNNEDGYHILAGHKNWMTFAEKLLEVGIEDAYKNFGKNYKDLFVYGGKVSDKRRHFASEGFWKFA